MARPSLFDAVGGSPTLLRLAAALHARCLADPELAHPFSTTKDPHHVQHLATYWGEVLGGPAEYSSSLGGHSHMLGLHAGQGVGAGYGERFVACFDAAMDDVSLTGTALTDDHELRQVLHDYQCWAVEEVLGYGPAGSAPAPGQAVPRWDWNGLQT